ncbi:hypothetical protein KKA14_09195, partial [bacterium]|nr:hypothetical protein [bacterium]
MKSVQNQEQRIWISQDIYIPVDSNGHCLGKYYEGAMGVIVEIIHLNGGSHALKIPWLMSDTPKENAYISELLTEERTCVMNIFSDGDNTSGLMQADVFGISVLQKSIQTRDARPEARAFHDSIVAVQFQRGKAPRFCAIHPDLDGRKKIKIFPQTIKDCPLEDKDVFLEAYHKAKSNETDWENSVAINLDSKNDSPDVYCLNSSFDSRNYENIWYIGVPATIYVWGSSTLHEAITEGKLADWNLGDQLVLLERITNGVHSLHRRGYLHTDIRPANIMSRGDCRISNNYFLIDYAGYNVGLSSTKEKRDLQGKTSEPVFLGPSIGGERNSPFYAPERKKGIEKEGADTAIVLDRKDHYLVLFGWRSILLKDEVPVIKDEILDQLNQFEFNEKTSNTHKTGGDNQQIKEDDLLLPGDRLQIRDYIFDIEAVGTLNDSLKGEDVYKCSKKYGRIFHGKIVINCDKPLEQKWMAIPRIIELRQWAVGTDCYGIGALFLYCLYRMPGDSAVTSKVVAEIAFQR